MVAVVEILVVQQLLRKALLEVLQVVVVLQVAVVLVQ